MKKGNTSAVAVIIAGALAGMIIACLITWVPIRLSFCAYYNTPDCEQIVLMVFPLYCIIGPLIGGAITYLIYRRQNPPQANDGAAEDGAVGENEGDTV